MPEIILPCGTDVRSCTAISVKMYRRYTEIMERNNGTSTREAYEANRQIITELFALPGALLDQADPLDVMAASKQIHFIMQEAVGQKWLDLNPNAEPIEKEKSLFDDYDEENGYNDDVDEEADFWKTMRENVDRIVKMCIRVLKQSYSDCMSSDIMSLLDYVAFEIKTVNEK